MRKFEGDILVVLGPDLCSDIISMLDDPADLVRVSCLSRAWYNFVVEGGFCKRLCLKLVPEVSAVADDIEEDHVIGIMQAPSRNYWVMGTLERNHNVYATLSRALSPTLRKDCISEAIAASNTDHYPLESIDNTLEPSDRIGQRPSYWSSIGSYSDWVPASLTYKLVSDLCFVTEINIQPFQVFFHPGNPVFSPKSVRFIMGFMMESVGPMDKELENIYVSPIYPMTQARKVKSLCFYRIYGHLKYEEGPVIVVVGRDVLQRGLCEVSLESSRDSVTIHPSEMEIVILSQNNEWCTAMFHWKVD